MLVCDLMSHLKKYFQMKKYEKILKDFYQKYSISNVGDVIRVWKFLFYLICLDSLFFQKRLRIGDGFNKIVWPL